MAPQELSQYFSHHSPIREIRLFYRLRSPVRTGLAADAGGELNGTVFTLFPDGKQFVVPGASVTLTGQSVSKRTISDERGTYRFTDVAAGSYQIEAKAPGLTGSGAVTVASGTAVETAVWLQIEAIKQSVTVKGGDERRLKKSLVREICG
jgi:hypothetical protein